jgi:peptide/nickel transport system substrate-binding protein
MRTLSIVVRTEPFDLTDSASSRNNITLALFVARLVHSDDVDTPQPVLSEAVPVLNTDTWQVFPDGRMETTFRLRPDLRWHDGTPLTAEDVVFTQKSNIAQLAWGLSQSAISPVEHRAIDEVTAPDPRTVVIRWKQLYADAVRLDMKILPRHILEPVVDEGRSEVLGAHPYWTTGYVGAGPYRMAQWSQGAFLEGTAFEGYALGRPKIERVRLTWSGDPNSTLARVLAGDADLALDGAIFYVQAATLKKEWATDTRGVVLIQPGSLRFISAQHRPAVANPTSVLDVRVRRAIAHAFDKQALTEALTEGYGVIAHTIAAPGTRYYAEVDRTAAKYPYDLRRVEQLMGEAGFTKGADGWYASPAEGRHTPEMMGVAEGQEGQETTVITADLRRAGFDVQLRLVPQEMLQQSDEMKATYPAWRTNYGLGSAKNLSSDRVLGSRTATLDNRWSGTNKMGWSHAAHDALYDRWTRTLDTSEADQLLVQIARTVMDELPYVPTYFDPMVAAHSANLAGPSLGFGTAWQNVAQWSWK